MIYTDLTNFELSHLDYVFRGFVRDMICLAQCTHFSAVLSDVMVL